MKRGYFCCSPCFTALCSPLQGRFFLSVLCVLFPQGAKNSHGFLAGTAAGKVPGNPFSAVCMRERFILFHIPREIPFRSIILSKGANYPTVKRLRFFVRIFDKPDPVIPVTFNTSDTRGNSPSYGTNYQKLGKELMSRDELAVMNGSKCILQLRGVRPFLSDKYDLTQHPNFKYTADYDKKYTFDIEKYLNRRMKLKKDEVFDVVEA